MIAPFIFLTFLLSFVHAQTVSRNCGVDVTTSFQQRIQNCQQVMGTTYASRFMNEFPWKLVMKLGSRELWLDETRSYNGAQALWSWPSQQLLNYQDAISFCNGLNHTIHLTSVRQHSSVVTFWVPSAQEWARGDQHGLLTHILRSAQPSGFYYNGWVWEQGHFWTRNQVRSTDVLNSFSFSGLVDLISGGSTHHTYSYHRPSSYSQPSLNILRALGIASDTSTQHVLCIGYIQ